MSSGSLPGFGPGSGKGLGLILLGFICFFAAVLSPVFLASDGKGFLLIFFVGFFLSFILMAAGGFLFTRAQAGGIMQHQQKVFQFSSDLMQAHVKQLAGHAPQAPPPPPAPVVIQNIGQYVAGNRVDIKDSVVMRSNLGKEADDATAPPGSQDVLEEYRRVLRDVWRDGSISPQEFEFLERVRAARDITLEQHRAVEREVFLEMGKPGS